MRDVLTLSLGLSIKWKAGRDGVLQRIISRSQTSHVAQPANKGAGLLPSVIP